MWEEKKYFWFIPYYVYSVWKGGKNITKWSFSVKNKETKEYFRFKPLPSIKIGKNEFKEKFNSNKWIVPTNYVIDLNND